ncbi:SigE family RNA polymerase sigma factor [Streptomyces sp. SID13031]|uniref:SigE family RNA polymerase sigma factor n=1 Tax=Streptomyces sp. SID13031 TaxID=2706046 RepID=UPI0013CC2929|nr:SigE family RNA polymerase sigma factor [Streptomyces sp. SID13031]NEA36272.1 SigE family RNA polymerase sigma factor [Streptomyces sp. SID13031]
MNRPTDFEEFASTQYAALLRTAYLLTQNRATAEDLVQATLAKCWLSWKRVSNDNPMPYVRRTMLNTYTSWWRRRWNAEYPTDELPHVEDPGGHHAVDTRTDLDEALRRLPKRMRAVIVLRFYEDLTETETARVLGCSVGTVKSQTSRALAKLRIDPHLLDWRESDLPREEQT